MSLTFLHTSHSHVNRFNNIVNELKPGFKVNHVVNEKLLTDAIKTGQIDRAGFDKQIKIITADTADKIICTCSTYGELCDGYSHVFRIDAPIVELIVSTYQSVAVAYTAASTRDSSINLIKATASRLNQTIEISELDCSHCWAYFTQDGSGKYETEIAKKIRSDYKDEEVIFLAQASMEGAKLTPSLSDLNIVSSAAYGVAVLLH